MHDCCPPYGEQRTSRPSYETTVERVRPRNPPTFCRARGGVESKHRLDSSRMCREIGSIGDSAARVSPNFQALCIHQSKQKTRICRVFHGASRTRTGDLLGAIQALSHLSYSTARVSV
jgi:hypothetical protein